MSLNSTNNSSCFPYVSNSSDFKIIASVRAASGLVSIVCGSLAILINVVHRKYLFGFQRMVLYFSVATAVDGIAAVLGRVDYLVDNEVTKGFCNLGAFMNEYGIWVIVMAVLAMACTLLMDVFGRPNGARCLQCVWPLLIFVLPLSFLWIPFVKLAYEQVPSISPWCTIRTVNEDCSSFGFGKIVFYTLNAPLIVISSAVVAFFLWGVFIICRRRRSTVFCEPHVIEHRMKLEKEALAFSFMVLLFFIAIILSWVPFLFNTNPNVFAVWIPFVVYNPAAIVSLVLTVDKDVLNKKSILNLFRPKSPVKEFNIAVVEGDNCSLVLTQEESTDKCSYHPLFDK